MRNTMKTHVTLWFLLLSCLSVQAQAPFPRKNAIWQIEIQWHGTSGKSYKTFGDTLLQGKNFAKIYRGDISTNWQPTYVGAYRVDSLGEKVYYWEKGAASDILIYDFSLQVGDTLPNSKNLVITSVDTVFDYGKLRRRQHFRLALNFGFIEEGVGSLTGPFETRYYDALDNQYELVCFSDMRSDSLKLSENPIWDCNLPLSVSEDREPSASYRLFPNPTTGPFTFSSTSSKPQKIRIFDARGQLVFETSVPSGELQVDLGPNKKGLFYLETEEGFGQKILIE